MAGPRRSGISMHACRQTNKHKKDKPLALHCVWSELQDVFWSSMNTGMLCWGLGPKYRMSNEGRLNLDGENIFITSDSFFIETPFPEWMGLPI